ncbi:MAG: DUF559 domain-containing protein [Geodermatophilaceae bacterium]|nr:DUF559 domain-containing protein [Geodermatophilaceae bacterium]
MAYRLGFLQQVHDGVYLTGFAPMTPVQVWWAATLTAPKTALALDSAGACFGFRPHREGVQFVVRAGDGGPRRFGDVRVSYSTTLKGHVTRRHGLLVTKPDRTVVDLWPRLRQSERERMLRDAVRLRLVTMPGLIEAAIDLRGRRGVAQLRTTVARYVDLPLHRCRSNAEVEGLLVLSEAGMEIPAVNVRRAGEEADFSWPDRKLIIEIDGENFHLDPIEDARKTRIWTRAGWTVRRIPSQDVFDRPERLIALAAA